MAEENLVPVNASLWMTAQITWMVNLLLPSSLYQNAQACTSSAPFSPR